MRPLPVVIADLRNALVPVCLLPEEIAVDFLTEDGREAVAGAKASLPRVRELLDELSVEVPITTMGPSELWDHGDGTEHSATGPMGCFPCANIRRAAEDASAANGSNGVDAARAARANRITRRRSA